MTDRHDDSYDLSWYHSLPQDNRSAIAQLRSLLGSDPDPIDRHFMYCELETRLYKLRDVEPTALGEYDEVCAAHDAEMDRVRPALYAKFGAVSYLSKPTSSSASASRRPRTSDEVCGGQNAA